MWNFEMSYPNRTKWKKDTIINDQIQQAWLGLFYLTYITVQVLAERKALRSMRTFGRCYLKCRSISVSKRTSQKDHYSSSHICFIYILPPTILNSIEFQLCVYEIMKQYMWVFQLTVRIIIVVKTTVALKQLSCFLFWPFNMVSPRIQTYSIYYNLQPQGQLICIKFKLIWFPLNGISFTTDVHFRTPVIGKLLHHKGGS